EELGSRSSLSGAAASGETAWRLSAKPKPHDLADFTTRLTWPLEKVWRTLRSRNVDGAAGRIDGGLSCEPRRRVVSIRAAKPFTKLRGPSHPAVLRCAAHRAQRRREDLSQT